MMRAPTVPGDAVAATARTNRPQSHAHRLDDVDIDRQTVDLKIQMVRRLADSLARDLNGVVTQMIGLSDRLSGYFAEGDPRGVDVEALRQNVHAAAAIAHHLLVFSVSRVINRTIVDVNQLVGEARVML